MRRTIFASAMILCSLSLAFADIAQPDASGKHAKSLDTALSIRIDRDAREAKLIIPRSQVQQLRAELEQIDDPNTAVAGSFGRTQTIVSGMLLSLAFIFGGIWFVRSSSQNSRAIAASAVLLTLGSVVNLVYGNAGPPSDARNITGKMFSQSVHMYKSGWGRIKLEVSDDARNPELIVPDVPLKVEE